MTDANAKCPGDCGGRLQPTDLPERYECTQCGKQLEQSVVESIESFKRVANGDGAAAEIARVALEGVDPE